MLDIQGVSGLVLVSKDPGALAGFYARALGCRFQADHLWHRCQLGATEIHIRGPHHAEATGFPREFTLRVDDLDAVIGRLLAAGVSVSGPLQADHWCNGDHLRWCSFEDPDGNRVGVEAVAEPALEIQDLLSALGPAEASRLAASLDPRATVHPQLLCEFMRRLMAAGAGQATPEAIIALAVEVFGVRQ
jgi:hypothetical protein